jgi:hypothetical protein
VKILIDFLKLWNFSYIIQLITRCSAVRVSVFDVVGSSITTTERSKHLWKSWSTFRKLWEFHHYQSFLAALQFEFSISASHRFLQVIESKMTSAFVSLINRRDYDESSSSSSSSSSSFASSQKKNYSEHTNEYITLLIKKWKSLNLQDTNLWATFRDDFERWTEQSFKTATNDVLRSLRNFLRKHDVWISRQKRKTIARSLQEVLEKKTETTWIEKKILNSLDEKFESSKIIRLIETDFERNSRDYSWQASSRSESRRASSRQSFRSRESSFRDRSSRERSLQQSSMKHLSRESSIARNFLRQSSSS